MSANLSAILEGLIEAGVDFILVGGLAAVVQGAPVTTMDVDIVHDQSPENISRIPKTGGVCLSLKKHCDNWSRNTAAAIRTITRKKTRIDNSCASIFIFILHRSLHAATLTPLNWFGKPGV
jgi:hypothetical protein